jgi:AraC-like DNA-binding protein
LTNYAEVARFCGLDPDLMLKEAGIDPAALGDPDRMISRVAAAQLLEDSAASSGCQSFGLLMAEGRPLSRLGPLSLLMTHRETARGAIDALIQYQSVLSEAHALGIEEADGLAIVRTGFTTGIGSRQAIELLTGTVCRAISEVVSGRWHPESAHFIHAAPDDVTIHRRVFQCPLVFDSDFNGLACPSAWLDAPNPAAESVMAEHAQRYLDMLIPKPADGSVTERARRSIYLLLPAGRATLDQVADNLALHPRTLQRLLDQEKRTFAMLLGDARRELALRYLSNSTHSVAAIAQMTGYSSPSAFTRWFAGEFGVAPAQWRAEGRRADDRAS